MERERLRGQAQFRSFSYLIGRHKSLGMPSLSFLLLHNQHIPTYLSCILQSIQLLQLNALLWETLGKTWETDAAKRIASL